MSKCLDRVHPGDVLQYNNEKSDRNGTIYLVAVRCGGKDRPKETCTFPTLIDVATGFSRKGTSSPPNNLTSDWKENGIPLVDIVGSKTSMFTRTSLMVGTPIKKAV